MRPRARWIAIVLLAFIAAVAAAQAATRQAGAPEHPATATATATAPAPAVRAEPELPALDELVPLQAGPLARSLRATLTRLDAAVDRWRADELAGDEPPVAVARLATYESRVIATLASRPGLRRAVLARLPGRIVRRIAPELRALRDLERLHRISRRKPGSAPRIRLGRPEPLTVLRRHYRDAQRRFGVGWHVLAAVNYVESRFGRLRNESISGARGPMQFMPATWRQYGLGGDVRDPRDAIMGAANYLRASGAPGSYARALHAYNPSSLYVRTVRMYANRIAGDRRALPALYAREVLAER